VFFDKLESGLGLGIFQHLIHFLKQRIIQFKTNLLQKLSIFLLSLSIRVHEFGADSLSLVTRNLILNKFYVVLLTKFQMKID
ncbi:hypothetical protein BpHYR1_050606, partial [Brachionus plicatilis]